MSTLSYQDAVKAIYDSLAADNEDIDVHIANLKSAMTAESIKEFAVQPDKLAQPNRAGRKMMQSYFKKRGVKVTFKS